MRYDANPAASTQGRKKLEVFFAGRTSPEGEAPMTSFLGMSIGNVNYLSMDRYTRSYCTGSNK